MNAIEIYDNADRKLNKSEITLGEYERMIDPLRNVIPILEGVTNGEVILAIFKEIQHYSDGKICASWWNSPYKGSEE